MRARFGTLFQRCLLALSWSWLSSTSLAYAQPPSPSQSASSGEDFQKKEAMQRFQEGVALMHDNKHEQARLKFVQAYAMTGTKPVPNVTFNLARAEHLTNHPLEASRHYREYLRTADPKKLTAKEREDIDGWLRDLGKVLGRVEITAPAGARLTIDGERVGDAPLSDVVDVTRGKHVVSADVKGAKRFDAEVDTTTGGLVKVTLGDEPSPASTTATGVANTTNAASPTNGSLPPTASAETPAPRSEGGWGTGQWLGVGLVGAGVVSLGAGLAFAIAKGSSSDDVAKLEAQSSGCDTNPSLRQCAQLADKRDEESTNGALSTAFLVGGVAAAIGGVVIFLVSPKAPATAGSASPRQPRLVPYFRSHAAGVQLRF